MSLFIQNKRSGNSWNNFLLKMLESVVWEFCKLWYLSIWTWAILENIQHKSETYCSFCQYWSLLLFSDGILKQSMGAWNRVGIGLSYRPARLAVSIPWNWFLGSFVSVITHMQYGYFPVWNTLNIWWPIQLLIGILFHIQYWFRYWEHYIYFAWFCLVAIGLIEVRACLHIGAELMSLC